MATTTARRMQSLLRDATKLASRSVLSSGRCIATQSIHARSLSSSATSEAASAPSSFDKVGVIGLGLMGHGICQTAASSGLHSSIVAYEPEDAFLLKGKDRIQKSLDKLVAKEKLAAEKAASILDSILFTTDMDALGDTDLIVEAIMENLPMKQELYTRLGHEVCKPETVFASNTSSLAIADMNAASGRPDKFVGIHFFNPVQLMKLVEVIRTDETDPAVFDDVFDWVKGIGKVPVSCGDTPGFIVNRLLVPSLLQAMLMVDRKDATVADIDVSLQLGAGHPMGPLHLADYIGLDTCLFIVQGWVEKYPDEPAFVLPESLVAKVEAGDFGRKSGRGFYVWDGDKRGDPVE
uniref:3-hydroxyacyl-CoA dehydrogenase n=1 Tax=Craspedostauros australis TaxID=1486917 RepID=A0A7R9ZSF7_9STRA|mmetsp:Transcript_8426/g.22798  ORF Transcript_8426/g.22798 Transcript_8426/m.22798 type:complete len:350 (+) Transcript_8426:183-1232(+)|eukprot:CAMPEP_0198116618 /NCGR_PEP_ID=MMETSP1442-20131203/13580_1 /TAXON_ID= /ORGANISM="Craspedostauros australis, Strain CCMP3328" /LENGTH=349 /DNA_ID=CAMNT_0043774487 /DNA_START=122 /DNA_END=1171 /DNA_ORIENTATION=+